jgi:hypothetical protein
VLPNLGPGEHIFGLTGDPDSWVFQNRPAFSRSVKIVCAECNSGWMSRLEMKARPIFEPMMQGKRHVILGPADQKALALWIVKTSMTLQLSHPSREPNAIPPAHYLELYTEQRPPRRTQVWIGGCTHDDRPAVLPKPMVGRCRIAPLRRFRPNDISPAAPTLAAYSVAMSMGNLAMAIFGHQYAESRAGIGWMDQMGEALVQIWPTADGPVTWPGKYALGYDAFDLLTKKLLQSMSNPRRTTKARATGGSELHAEHGPKVDL